jgi:hypothetical protein
VAQQSVKFHGITSDIIQKCFENALANTKYKCRWMFLDLSYLYTFDKSDVPYIGKFTRWAAEQGAYYWEDGRWVFRNPKMICWHNFLEQWMAGQSVELYNMRIKPTQITQAVDRVPNEALERLCSTLVGEGEFLSMKYNAIGDGAVAGSSPSPNDTALYAEVNRINVITDEGGGGVSRDGSTFYNIANHPISVPSTALTEVGVFDRVKPGAGGEDVPVFDDNMGDHSIFPVEIDHDQNQDSPGSTVIIYMCSS